MYREDTYNIWERVCDDIVSNKIMDWKQNSQVTYMLEHESFEAANAYFQYLKNFFSKDEIVDFLSYNDKYGSPKKQQIDDIVSSTSSLRYLRHSFELCSYIKSKGFDSVNVIEIGGGYGGMALLTSLVSKYFKLNIKKYTIYDLPNVQKLQNYYLSNFELNFKIEWNDSSKFGSEYQKNNTPTILFSSYAVSELPMEFRKSYLTNLLPMLDGAFLIWNGEEHTKTELPSIRKEVPEIPNTNSHWQNVWIWF